MARKGGKNKKTKNKNKNVQNGDSKGERKRKNRENLRKIAEQNFGKFVEQMTALGLRIKEVRGDGNCLFRSVSDQLEGNENNHTHYRQEAIDYMVANQDHFKFFIEDDKTFDQYIADMSKDGTWGGNLEIYALSMKFTVNFYIYIYNHPMYIVRNFDNPNRSIHCSYHDGEHYNSVRLQTDFENEIPIVIPLELINCVEQTTNVQALNANNIENDADLVEDEEDDENFTKKHSEENLERTNSSISNNDDFELNCKGVLIKNLKSKSKNDKLKKSIMTQEGNLIDDIKDLDKCHCNKSNKKYKNCCINDDIKGEFDNLNNIFYCNLSLFKTKINLETNKNKEDISRSNSDVNITTKQMEKIFI